MCFFVCFFKHSFINLITCNVIFASSNLFHIVLFLVQPTEFPQVQFQFNQNNDVLTSKEYIAQYLFWDWTFHLVDESMHQTAKIRCILL